MTADQITRPLLPQVTLVAVTSVAIEPTVEALRKSMRQAQFAKVLLLTDHSRLSGADPAIVWQPIDRLHSRADYSRFMLRDLAHYITTDFALCIQWDGFVLDGGAWNPRFLDYDYIGAVWPHFPDGRNVGNGGFSLRSRRLLEACRNLPFDGLESEDVVIARTCREGLEKQGISFAPEMIARQFAYERTAPTGREFGFHGAYNLVRHLSAKDAHRVFNALEPALLARNERHELLWWALVRGRFRLAQIMIRKMLRKTFVTR